MKKSMLRGHEIELIEDKWVYSDTKEPTVETWRSRPCGACGRHNTPEDHDGCLGTLAGVMNACCGHGEVGEAYVQFSNGKSVYREEAVQAIKLLKKDEV